MLKDINVQHRIHQLETQSQFSSGGCKKFTHVSPIITNHHVPRFEGRKDRIFTQLIILFRITDILLAFVFLLI